jgi:hypothetical protein
VIGLVKVEVISNVSRTVFVSIIRMLLSVMLYLYLKRLYHVIERVKR